MGVVFEMPILVFFLALMGVVSAGWMWRNFRYSILVIFIIAAIFDSNRGYLEHVYLRRAHDRTVRTQHRDRVAGASETAQGAAARKGA